MEACRRACGGHGFSQLSGLPSILQNYVQNVTWEGDNNVMLLQARTGAIVCLCLPICPGNARAFYWVQCQMMPSIQRLLRQRALVEPVLSL